MCTVPPPLPAAPGDVQVPRKLGVFATSQLLPSPYATPPQVAATQLLVEAVAVLVIAAARDAPPTVESVLAQQMTDSGLVTCLDQLAEATAAQLEQCDVAAAATGSGVSSTTKLRT